MKKNQIPALLKKHKANLRSVVVSDSFRNEDLIYHIIERQLGLKAGSKKAWDRITQLEEDRGWSQAWVYDLGLDSEQILFIRKPPKSSATQINIMYEYFLREDMIILVDF